MTVNHGVLGSSPCSGADTRGLRIESSASRARPPKGRMTPSRPQEKIRAKICRIENFAYLCNAQAIFRELSSAGSERLPYKQRVGGSNPSAPTRKSSTYDLVSAYFFLPRYISGTHGARVHKGKRQGKRHIYSYTSAIFANPHTA